MLRTLLYDENNYSEASDSFEARRTGVEPSSDFCFLGPGGRWERAEGPSGAAIDEHK